MPGVSVCVKAAALVKVIDVPSGRRTLTFCTLFVKESGIASPTKYCALRAGALPLSSSIEYSNGTNLDDKASWLSEGCHPDVRMSNEPFPTGACTSAASPSSNFAMTRAPGILSTSI